MPNGFKNVCFTTSFDKCPSGPVFGHEDITFLVFQKERGKDDGYIHWQGYAEASRVLSIKQWQDRLVIGKSRIAKRNGTQEQAVKYCKKDDTRVEMWKEFGELSRNSNTDKKRQVDDVYLNASANATSQAEYISMCSAGDPSGVAKSFNSIKKHAEYLFPTDEFKQYTAPKSVTCAWSLTDQLKDWLKNEFTKSDRPKCLVLVGASRLGKTAWARSLGRHMYWRGMTNVTCWDERAKYIIFDDIEWKFIPQKKSLLTCMGDATVTDKYKGKKDIVVDKVAIVLLNEFDIDSIEESSYWKKNLTIVTVTQPLFDVSQRLIQL